MRLQWESPHILRLIACKEATVVHLQVNKPNGFQNLACTVPQIAGFIRDSFAKKNDWTQVCEKKEDENYFAVRVIHLTNGLIVWIVDHRDGVPGDDLFFAPGANMRTLAEEYGK